MESTPAATLDTSDSTRLLRRRWWVIVLATLLGLGGTGLWLHAQEPVWESTTSVLVHPARDLNLAEDRAQTQVNLDTEAQLVRSTAVATAATGRLRAELAPEQLAHRVSVQVPANTSVLMITFSAATPEQAQAGSQAFAEAYLDSRRAAARVDLATRTEVLEARIDELTSSLTAINERLAHPGNRFEEINLDSQRSTLTDQLSTATGRLNELATATWPADAVISEAGLPTEPSRPHPALVLAGGAMLGLVLGTGAAVTSERLVRRVRRPADIPRHTGIPVRAVLTRRMLPRGEEILTPYATGGRVFDRLRNEILAELGGPGKIIVVTSTSRGSTASLVAANLAVSLARGGDAVILVGARVPDNTAAAGPMIRLLDVAPTPGLSEVLSGRTSVTEALQSIPNYPRMRAMPVGGASTATRLLQPPTLAGVLAALVRQAAYVVVEAPPTTTSADAQSLARHADTALLVVEPREARLADVADAAEQLRRVGIPMAGAVVVPPLPRDPEAGRRAKKPTHDTVTGGLPATASRPEEPQTRAHPHPHPRPPGPRAADTVEIPQVDRG